MYIKIRDIKVINANLLACPYTAGFSLASFKGLMDAISFKMTNNENINDNIIFKGFGVIISSVNSKINEPIQRDSSTGSIEKGKYNLPSMLQTRYFDFTFDFVLEIDDEVLNQNNFFDVLVEELNSCKVQGGIIDEFIQIKNISKLNNLNSLLLTRRQVNSEESYQLNKDTYALSYFILDATNELNEDLDLTTQLEEKLLDSKYMLICNGYKDITNVNYERNYDFIENKKHSILVEPNLILSKTLSVHEFNKDPSLLKNFIFSNYEKNNYKIVHALN